jgi:hypothetical protein
MSGLERKLAGQHFRKAGNGTVDADLHGMSTSQTRR